MNPNHYVAIMAGGVGSRFWPASREAKPKQFLDILGIGKSLLQMTYDRFLPLIPKENIFIVTNAAYRDLIKEQLPDVTDNQILAEPSRNNTAPCLAYTAFKLQNLNPNATFVVASSDHLILKETAFLENIKHERLRVAQKPLNPWGKPRGGIGEPSSASSRSSGPSSPSRRARRSGAASRPD